MALPRTGALVLVIAAAFARPAHAQATSQRRGPVAQTPPPPIAASTQPQLPARPRPAARKPRVLRWTIELHGGYVGLWTPTSGFGAVPDGGPDFVTANDFVSPSASSWFFGRGAGWLNAYAKPETPAQIVPLDSMLTSASARRDRGGSAGLRLTREINQRLDLEVVVDRSASDFTMAPGVVNTLQTTTVTFQKVWAFLLGGMPRSSASSELTGTDTLGHRTYATAALDYFISFGRVTPFIAAGAGVAANTGSVDATITGDLQFQNNTFAEHQTDTVAISFGERRYEPVVVIGAGLVASLTKRIGVRLDLRSYLVSNGLRTTVSATPATVGGSGVTDLMNATGLPIQFNSTSGPPSTLSVPVANVTTFNGLGWHKQLSATFGCFFRF